eukprot:symbB.v1.2.025351.t1/scaffold2454.1/size78847/6
MDSMPETFNSSYGAAVVLGHTFLRARCSTTTWKFIDDLAWRLSTVTCHGLTGVLVEMHSQQRAGAQDGGQNMYRVRFSMMYLNETFPDVLPFDVAC